MLQPPSARSAEEPDPVALTVDGEPVARSEYARWLLGVRGEASWQQFAEAWLVERRARQVGLEITPEEVEARVRAELDRLIAQSYQGDRAVWRAYLAAAGSDEQLYLQQLAGRQRLSLLVEAVTCASARSAPPRSRRASGASTEAPGPARARARAPARDPAPRAAAGARQGAGRRARARLPLRPAGAMPRRC